MRRVGLTLSFPKAEPNMQNEFGETALHYAVRLGAVKCIELLLAANADVFLEGEREEGSALTLAEVTGQAEILGMMKRSSSCVALWQSFFRLRALFSPGTWTT